MIGVEVAQIPQGTHGRIYTRIRTCPEGRMTAKAGRGEEEREGKVKAWKVVVARH
jgi:hypothetical protein